jgi:hypothetical protein
MGKDGEVGRIILRIFSRAQERCLSTILAGDGSNFFIIRRNNDPVDRFRLLSCRYTIRN